MDRLALNAMLARQAGMSYGKWKAMQKPIEVQKEAIPDGWQVCEWCGKPFKPKTKKKQRFCEIGCQKKAYAIIWNEKKRKERKNENQT